jgi:hypothetical protein
VPREQGFFFAKPLGRIPSPPRIDAFRIGTIFH